MNSIINHSTIVMFSLQGSFSLVIRPTTKLIVSLRVRICVMMGRFISAR